MATTARGVTSALSGTAASKVAAGANEAIVFTNVSLMNLDTTSRLVTFYQVASGGSATTANQCLVQSVITGQSTTVPAGAFVIANGASLWAKTDSGTSVNLSLNYYTTDQQA
jgi:hypothetical protein